MIKHEAGLHKDVAKIFDGVWIPETDNIQASVSTVYKDSGCFCTSTSRLQPITGRKEQKSKKGRNLHQVHGASFLRRQDVRKRDFQQFPNICLLTYLIKEF